MNLCAVVKDLVVFFFFSVSILHMESQVQNNNKNLDEAFQKKYIKRYKNYARFHFTPTCTSRE